MIYPKDIVDFVSNDETLRRRFPLVCAEHPLHTFAVPRASAPSNNFEKWMLYEGRTQCPGIKRYLFFLSVMSTVFEHIRVAFDKQNPGRENEKDSSAIATSPQEMFFIARYLYYLDSYGVTGDVLECGCFKGFSSCCLSWACSYLRRSLIIADSFEGLPDIGHWYYRAHDFKGDLQTVQNNLYAFGRPDCVEFIKGWYSQSLSGFNRPISLLWMDVDLYQSAKDVLTHVFPSLNKDGVIFSHEFNADCISDHSISSASPSDVAKAMNDYFTAHHISHHALFLTGCLALVVPNAASKSLLLSRGTTLLFRRFGLPGHIFSLPEPSSLSVSGLNTRFSIDLLDEQPINWSDPMAGTIAAKHPICRNQDEITVSGWAIDEPAAELSGGIYIDIDGKLYPAYHGLDRADVAGAFNSPKYRHSGFEAIFPLSELQVGQHRLSIRVLTKDQKSFYSPTRTVTFTVAQLPA